MLKTNKAILIMVLVISLALIFVACDKPEETPEPTEKATATATPNITEAPTEEPTAEPTAEPTQEPTAEPTTAPTAEPTPEPVIYFNDDFSSLENSEKNFILTAFTVENGLLKGDFGAFALQGEHKVKNFTLLADVKMIEHEEGKDNHIGMWIGENLSEKKVTIGYWPKENKVKIIYNNEVLKEATVDAIGLNKNYNLAFKLTSDNVVQIYIDKKLVLEHKNPVLYKYDNIIVFWNNSNKIEIDNMLLADEHYSIK